MDLHLLANRPEHTRTLYQELDKLKLEKTEVAENLMAEASLRLGSKAFFLEYLVPQGRLKLIYRHHLTAFVELLATQRADVADIARELQLFLAELRKAGIRLAVLDLVAFKRPLQLFVFEDDIE